jgi:Skp family chaperone for outer membrane proteins
MSSAKSFEIFKIGVLDGEKLKSTAICFKSHERIAEAVTALLSKIQKAESQTKSAYEKVKNDQNLSSNEKNKELSRIETKWKRISSQYNSEMQSIKNSDIKLSDLIQMKLLYVIETVAKFLNLNLILNKSSGNMLNVFYNSKDIDVTDLIIQKLDEILPNIDLEELEK